MVRGLVGDSEDVVEGALEEAVLRWATEGDKLPRCWPGDVVAEEVLEEDMLMMDLLDVMTGR